MIRRAGDAQAGPPTIVWAVFAGAQVVLAVLVWQLVRAVGFLDSPALRVGLLVLICLATAGLAACQAIGGWRAWPRGPSHARARAALLALGAGAFCMFLVGRPLFNDVLECAGAGDGAPPGPAGIRLLRSGTELEISGPLTASVMVAFEKALPPGSLVKTVQLDSPGGSFAAARQIAARVAGRGLDTYVGDSCRNACAVIFMAGAQRWAGPFGQVTLAVSQGGLDLDGDYARAGVPVAVRREVADMPADEAWSARGADLVTAGLATRLATTDTFALAGFGPAPTAESIQARLLAVPLYRAVAAADPDGFARDVALWVATVQNGETGTAAFQRTSARIDAVFQRALAAAPPPLLIEYVQLIAEELQWARDHGAAICDNFAVPVIAPVAEAKMDLVGQLADLKTRVIMGAGQNTGPAVAPDDEMAALAQALAAKHLDADLAAKMMAGAAVPGKSCATLFAVYNAMQNIPRADLANIMRAMAAAAPRPTD